MSATTTTTTTVSQRRPGMGFDEFAFAQHAWKGMAQEGYRAIKELERILFFTDIQDNVAREEAAQEGLKVLDDLEMFLNANRPNNNNDDGDDSIQPAPSADGSTSPFMDLKNYRKLVRQEIRKAHGQPEDDEVATPKQDSTGNSQALTLPGMNIMELLKAHFNAVLHSSQKAVQEAERTIFFTDLDDAKMTQLARSGDHKDVWKEVELVLQEMEVKLASFAVETAQGTQQAIQHVGQKSRAAYKECERTLLFTDLDENKLAQDKTNDDVISHFLNTQDVFQELQQKFCRTQIQHAGNENSLF